ncbi:mevalonate kinase [Pokkaliibacter sp. CJK22405]|uniref:mevalonate kinase family protein n=1 Tax=Pokkaliibacter sp. CJK22405 TaxID=3384615 RepID=UPI003985330D
MASDWNRLKVSAPGSLMVMGEHAVLHDQWAIATAVDRRIELSLVPRDDRNVIIRSSLANYEASLNQLLPHPQLKFVLEAIAQAHPSQGFEVDIESAIDHTVGLGSSAAVTAAMVAALAFWENPALADDKALLLQRAHEVVLAVQGRGSGTDLAASVYGGLLGYRVDGRQVKPLPAIWPITLVYCGYKTPTPEVLQKVHDEAAQCPSLYSGIYHLMGQAAEQAMTAAELGNDELFMRCMQMQHGLLDALGVCDETLADIVYHLRQLPGVSAAKISGSGLGDSVLALGHTSAELPWQSIAVSMSSRGVEVVPESI